MNTSIVKVTGKLTNDPEPRFTTGDSKAVTDVKGAVNLRPWRMARCRLPSPTPRCSGDARPRNSAASLRKGHRVDIIGELAHRAWIDTDGAQPLERIIRNATIAPPLECATVQITRHPESADPEFALSARYAPPHTGRRVPQLQFPSLVGGQELPNAFGARGTASRSGGCCRRDLAFSPLQRKQCRMPGQRLVSE
ncbi:single-stranded DNA-binding protein [Antricoccus suffuscus]|uniref:Single-stranded DNA-binding protein n=1 Tax=Antricoccus suffuscus TaxID=1629062 RepID=A0A2T0ZTN7_9ACTN|nr:single-stranded DNA-binding protein [Antricoccus suffuscus]